MFLHFSQKAITCINSSQIKHYQKFLQRLISQVEENHGRRYRDWSLKLKKITVDDLISAIYIDQTAEIDHIVTATHLFPPPPLLKRCHFYCRWKTLLQQYNLSCFLIIFHTQPQRFTLLQNFQIVCMKVLSIIIISVSIS